ncbi:beta-1,6-N-acetylglucosaminyltransferase [Poseidonocella sedimentorum]|uniref:Peptide O-xylosyltransferase n=1 Tax=Poseidonocella sedimentorum TaxID=871652 RepID=A0A1I6D4F9_9RHOB|nr:beta-1,6-N-acetylglucosaminyltransferase [Poseidonocella sedimentorum]SFR00197.1 Core-2/I-Branching enzyme [Poseidonocella sedimentorum]
MSVGFVMLVHGDVARAGQVARHLAAQGAPVVIHLDKRMSEAEIAPLRRRLTGMERVVFSERHACEWGSWGLTRATQEAAALLLRRFAGVDRVFLTSGACMPLRPVAELEAFLKDHPDTDFIESASTADVPWAVGGLHDERFKFFFPVSWKKRRGLFDAAVRLQRRLGLRRTLPDGLVPHMGSQWWCLTRETLTRILTDPRRERFDRFFRWVWIPDESYFQSLARRHARKLQSRSLTLTKFDFQGKPHIFYDDHFELLRDSGFFFARKIWPGAEALYARFLSAKPPLARPERESPGRVARVFDRARARRTEGRPGLYMQSSFPHGFLNAQKTPGPYAVFSGFDDVFPEFQDWAARSAGQHAHGHLFAPNRAEFAGGGRVYDGALSDNARLRDYNPKAFLTNVLWNAQERPHSFLHGPEDKQDIADFFAQDARAHVFVITGAWAISLCATGQTAQELRTQAAWLQKTEARFLDRLHNRDTQAQIHIWTLAEFLARPMDRLQGVLEDIATPQLRRLTEVPRLADLSRLPQFLQDLKNMGMHPYLTGDFAEGMAEVVTDAERITAAGNG